MATYDAGIVTAYGAAVRGGYTGTYEEFCAQQANYAQNAAAVEQAKQDAQAAAQDASESAETLSESVAQIATNTQDISTLKEDLSDMDDRVTALEQGSGSSLTEVIKQALLQIAEKVAYIDEHGQDYYDALEDALYPPADLVSISCVYTQSSTVYDTDSLDSLKHDLVVTAHMSDSTTQIVTTYALSGTLTKGTSVIPVSYGGKTTTFEVYAEDGASILYALPNATVFNGTSDYIDTDIQLRKEDISFTIFLHVSKDSNETSHNTVLHCMHEASPYDGLMLDYYANEFNIICGTGSAITGVSETEISEDGIYVAVTHEQGTSKYDAYYKTATTVSHTLLTYNFVSIDETVIIGAYQNTGGVKGRYFKGTIHDLKILAEVADDQSILNYLGVSTAPNLVYELPSTTVLNGTSDYIDTDIQLLKKGTGFAVLIDTTLDAISDNTQNNTLLHCMDEGASGYPGITVGKPSNGIMRLAIGTGSTSFSPGWKFGYRGRIGIVKHFFSNTVDVYYVNTGDSSISHIFNATAIQSIDKTLLIGAYRDASDVKGRFIKGTIHDIKIYTGDVPTDTVTEWVQGGME